MNAKQEISPRKQVSRYDGNFFSNQFVSIKFFDATVFSCDANKDLKAQSHY